MFGIKVFEITIEEISVEVGNGYFKPLFPFKRVFQSVKEPIKIYDIKKPVPLMLEELAWELNYDEEMEDLAF